jgi:hypothetical protein
LQAEGKEKRKFWGEHLCRMELLLRRTLQLDYRLSAFLMSKNIKSALQIIKLRRVLQCRYFIGTTHQIELIPQMLVL